MNIHETTKRRAIFRLCNRIAERTESNRAIWVTWGCELLGLPGDYSPDLVVKAHNEAVRVDNETGHAGATAKAIIGALTAPAPIIATRCTMHEAKRHFEAGGAVLVSEYGHEPTQTVTAITTTHDRTRTTWDALAADVKEWRNRYPNQRFYIVPRPGVVAVDDARPADPDGTHFIGCGCDETERDDASAYHTREEYEAMTADEEGTVAHAAAEGCTGVIERDGGLWVVVHEDDECPVHEPPPTGINANAAAYIAKLTAAITAVDEADPTWCYVQSLVVAIGGTPEYAVTWDGETATYVTIPIR